MSGRCLSCNRVMTSFELTRRYSESNQYVDLCNTCFDTIPNFPSVIIREDLQHDENLFTEVDYIEDNLIQDEQGEDE